MKKVIFFLIVLFISTSAFTQVNIENEFYFRFGYSIPSWSQYGGTKSEYESYEVNRFGFTGEIGSIFILKRISLPENLALGLNVDYLSFYWHQIQSPESAFNLTTIRWNSKIGPSFTYSPINNIAFDAFVKADICWITTGDYINTMEESIGFENYGAIGLSAGINIRLNVVMLGIEFNTINQKLEEYDNAGSYIGNFIDENDNGDKSKIPSMTFSLGLSF